MSETERDGRAPVPPTPGPTTARRILDDLESEVGELPVDDGGLQGDFVERIPGASEPPD